MNSTSWCICYGYVLWYRWKRSKKELALFLRCTAQPSLQKCEWWMKQPKEIGNSKKHFRKSCHSMLFSEMFFYIYWPFLSDLDWILSFSDVLKYSISHVVNTLCCLNDSDSFLKKEIGVYSNTSCYSNNRLCWWKMCPIVCHYWDM